MKKQPQPTRRKPTVPGGFAFTNRKKAMEKRICRPSKSQMKQLNNKLDRNSPLV